MAWPHDKPGSFQRFVAPSIAALVACATRTVAGWRGRSTHRGSSSVSTSRCSSRARSLLLPLVGRDFFPSVDAGLDQAARARSRRHPARGNRDAASRASSDHPHGDPGARDRDLARRHAAGRTRGINLSLSEGAPMSPADGQILISLKPGHPPTAEYVRALREVLRPATPRRRSSSWLPTFRPRS